jgi:hypothetical protein
VTSKETVQIYTSQVTTKPNTKRSRGRDQFKSYNVPTPSYTTFSPGRNSSSTSSGSGTRRVATNSQLDPPPPNSLLEKTRRIAMKQAATAAAAAASTRMERGLGTTGSFTQQIASQQSRKPVPIVNSKSIVGTRYVYFYICKCSRVVSLRDLKYVWFISFIHSDLLNTILYSIFLLSTVIHS